MPSWKEEGRWNYICPKISYIPAERNIVAAIPNWFVNKETENGKYIVRTATEKEVQEVYDYSIDVFHNLESLG